MKHRKLLVKLHGQTLTLNAFASAYGIPYSTALRYYNRGFRNEQLFETILQKRFSTIQVKGRTFKTKKEAAQYFNMSYSTFLRKMQNKQL